MTHEGGQPRWAIVRAGEGGQALAQLSSDRAKLDGTLGFGVETLALLPVQSDQGGAGIESQFLTTLKHDDWRLHFNAGAFYDPRGDDTVRG